jgi:two-component system, NarL family, response regulator NreC
MSAETLRILLADDHTVLREGLAMLVEAQHDMCVVAQAGDGREAVRLAESARPDVAVLDISMPELSGAEVIAQIRRLSPHTHILVLTRHADQGYVRRMMNAGASGYILKKTASSALIEAIRTVARGEIYVDSTLLGGLVQFALGSTAAAGSHQARAALSPREEEVLRLIAWGHSNKQIAAKLNVSVKTVESYKATGTEKLGVRNRAEILRYALAQGWLSEDAGPDTG